MDILITGGTGFLGSALTRKLLNRSHNITILTRQPAVVFSRYGDDVKAIRSLSQLTPQSRFDAVINLAGEGIADRPWTPTRKEALVTSRLQVTDDLVRFMKTAEHRPGVFISGSAIGIYGNQKGRILNEETVIEPHAGDFAQQLCLDWEKSAHALERKKVRICYLRTGLVLGRSGGMLKKLVPVFSLGLGGRLGDGQQMMSWIHIDDWVNMVLWLLTDETQKGVFNATAPKPVSNAEFTKTLARTLHRPALIPAPASLLTFMLGEMSEMLLGGQLVLPTRALSARFEFKYKTLDEALQQELA